MKITVKGLKTWTTHDGGGWQATILMDGKPLCFAHNDGNGGPLDFESRDNARWNAYSEWLMAEPVETFKSDIEGLTLADEDYDLHLRREIHVSALIDEELNAKRYRRLCKTKTVVKLKSDKERLVVFNRPYSPDMQARMEAKYGADLDEILNVRYGVSQ